MKNKLLKLLSLLMAFILVFTIIPIGAYAADNEKTSEVQVVELEDYRDTYSKTFETSEGTNVVITSASPLHYEKGGKMKEINNTLVESKKDDSKLTNKSNAFSVEFPKKYDTDSEISLDYQGNSISFKIADENISKSKGKTEKQEEVEVDKTDLESVAYSESNMEELSSSITYENVLENTDIEYNINPDSLKESIILKVEPKEEYSIQYELNIGYLTAKLNKDNSISILDGKKEQFKIESPYMFDSNELESDSIEVSLSKSKDGYILSYVPDYKWLTSNDILYPVTIDPTITISNDGLNIPIKDTYVTSSSPSRTKSSQNNLTIGANKWAYFDISTLPSLPDNSVIKKATLNLFSTADIQSNGYTLVAHPLSDEEYYDYPNINAYTWNNQPDLSNTDDIIVDHGFIRKIADAMCFDVTNLAKEWYLNSMINHVIYVKPFDGSEEISIASSEYSSDTSKRPYFLVEFSVMSGIDNGCQFHTQNANLAGTAYINDYTGELTVERTDVTSNGTMGDIKFYMGKSVNTPYNDCFGENTSINYYKTLKIKEQIEVQNIIQIKECIITNADGSKKHISNGDGFTINNDMGNGIIEIIYVDEENNTITDTYSKNTLSINSSLDNDDKIFTLIQHTVEKEYSNSQAASHTFDVIITYSNDKIISISDELVKYNISYASGVISAISRNNDYNPVGDDLSEYSDMFSINEIGNTYSYVDNGAKLNITLGTNDAIDVVGEVDAYDEKYISYIFNNNNEITQIIDENQKVYQYQYTNDKVSRVQEGYKNGNSVVNGDFLTFEYDAEKTSISDGTNTYIESFDSDGSIISTTDNDGNAVFVNDNGLISNIKNSQQYIINRYEFDNANELFFTSENNSNGSVNQYTGDKFSGASSVNITTQSRKKGEFSGRFDGLNKYSSYTVAIWIKGKTNKVTLKLDNTQVTANFVQNSSLNPLNEWEQYICTIGTENSNYLDFGIVVQNLNSATAQTIYIDHMYIQHSSELTAENLINNSDFSSELDDWYTENSDNITGTENGYFYQNTQVPTIDNERLIMQGIYNGTNEVSQIIDIDGFNEGDKYTFGAWMKAEMPLPEKTYNISPTSQEQLRTRTFSISVDLYNDDYSYVEVGKISYSTYKYDWQYIAGELTLSEDALDGYELSDLTEYSYLRVRINYNYQIDEAYVDGIFLAKEALYNSKQEPIIDNSTNQSSVMSYEYDDFGNKTKSTEIATVDEIVKKITSQSTYSDNGRLITNTCNILGNQMYNLYYKFDYLGNMNYKYETTNDIIAIYDYDNFSNLATIFNFYEKNSSDSETMRIKYTYNGKRLEKIETGSITPTPDRTGVLFNVINTYTLNYDDWGNLHEVFINDLNNPYITYNYNSSKYHQLDSIVYINGQVIAYEYNAKGNLVEKADSETSADNTLRYRYYYLDNGTCYGKEDLINGTVVSYQLGTITIFDEDGNILSYVGYDADGTAYYIACNNDIETSNSNNVQSTTIDNETSNVTQEFDEFGRLSSEKYQVNGSNTYIIKEYTYCGDGLNQTDKEYDTGNNGFINSLRKVRYISYYFVDSNNNKSLIDEYRYLYYADGEIASISISDDENNYSSLDENKMYNYNNNNMIIEESSDLLTKDTIYEYDLGNVSKITNYEYPNGIFAPRIKASEYVLSYDGNNRGTALKDCLTNFDVTIGNNTKNVDISYDEMGNISEVTYSGAGEGEMNASELNWSRGNILESIDVTNHHQTGDVTINDVVTYLYDDDNLRFNKHINMGTAETTTVNYTWLDNKLVGESIDCTGTVFDEQVNNNTVNNSGNYNIVILYDQNGNAYGFETFKSVTVQGNETIQKQTYYYLKDAENTIYAIIDTSGNKLVNYEYNAWGLPTVDYAEGYKHLMLINPLIYRDNIYDNESGLYYFNSKYYSPKVTRFISANSPLEIKNNSAISGNLYVLNENDPVNAK